MSHVYPERCDEQRSQTENKNTAQDNGDEAGGVPWPQSTLRFNSVGRCEAEHGA